MTKHPDPMIDPAACGVEVSWSFGDGNADAVKLSRKDVRNTFASYGLLTWAPEASIDEDDALRRVRRQGTSAQDLSIRELARPHKDTPRCIGVYVRRGSADGQSSESGDGWEMVARVRVQAGSVAALPPEGTAQSAMLARAQGDKLIARGIAEAKRLSAIAESLLDECHNADLSRALVDAARASGCVSRRPGGGGVYMIFNGPAAEQYVRLLQALAQLTEACDRSARFSYQAQEVYAKPLTVASWRESTEQQLAAELGRLLGDMEVMVARGVMREKTRAARGAEADAACVLAEQARVFLGSTADGIKAQFEQLSRAFSAAVQDDMTEAARVLASIPDATRKAKHAQGEPATQPTPAEAKQELRDNLAADAAVVQAQPIKRGRIPINVDKLFGV